MNEAVLQIRKKQLEDNIQRINNNPNNYNVEQLINLDYIGDGDSYHYLDIYSPKGFEKKKLPLLVEVHGGAYVSCFKEINRQHAQYFASKGFRVVNINYTLHPEADMRTEMKEIFAIFDWIAAHTDDYGFDVNRVFLTGDSAGGHLVMMVAAIQGCEDSQKYFHIKPFSYGLKGIAATCPLADYKELFNQCNPFTKNMRVILKNILDDEEYLHHTSYQNFMKEGYPDIMILTTPTDYLLYEHTKQIHEYMDRKEIVHTYKEYTSKKNILDHVFNVLYPDYEESEKANEDIIAFFKKRM